jgi:hypothetical protein
MRAGRVAFVLLAVTAAAATFAAAASIGVASGSLGAGNSAIGACDPDGFTFTRVVNNSGAITSLTIGGIAAACAGGTLSVNLTNSSNASIGSATASLPSSGFGGSATVTPSPAPTASSVNAYRASIVGP